MVLPNKSIRERNSYMAAAYCCSLDAPTGSNTGIIDGINVLYCYIRAITGLMLPIPSKVVC